ncbi:hypothetical protein ACOMHN_003224 [Nucella lapillus]
MAEAHYPGTISSNQADPKRVPEETNGMEPQVSPEDVALQRFLQQQRSDLMYELRRIQFGERPVTGQNHREQIASFMAKHSKEPVGAGGKNVPANVDAVEEHRPEAVLVEVQGVVEQRRVSSMLQSSNFRRHLENIIRGSISSASQSVSAAAAITARARASSTPRPATPEVLPVNSAQSSAQAPVANRAESVASLAAQPIPRPRPRDPAPRPNIPRQAQGSVEPAPAAEEPGSERRLWDTISDAHHEEMVFEISDLLHRRLVSSTLGSEFRTIMELHVQEHVSRTETDGEAVANFIQNIPQSQAHIPNDFRHMGIAPGPWDDNSDNISITGISATAVPYTQTNLHLNREMQSLKSQMEEMKNMLRLSFDLQLDIQRAIRQEVAAAIGSATAQGGATAAPAVHSTPVNDTHCLICLDNHTDSVLYQCGHMCVCFTCGKNLMTRGNGLCPVCRAPIKDIIRAYKTNTE